MICVSVVISVACICLSFSEINNCRVARINTLSTSRQDTNLLESYTHIKKEREISNNKKNNEKESVCFNFCGGNSLVNRTPPELITIATII